MNLVKKYRIIIAAVLPLLILLVLKTCSNDTFKYNAKKWAAPSFDLSNVVTEQGMGNLPGQKLIVDLDDSMKEMNDGTVTLIHISPDSLINKSNLKRIREHNGPVLLSSSDPALSARLWMILSQTGFKNLYIFSYVNTGEDFKNEFRPDTTVRPEI